MSNVEAMQRDFETGDLEPAILTQTDAGMIRVESGSLVALRLSQWGRDVLTTITNGPLRGAVIGEQWLIASFLIAPGFIAGVVMKASAL